MIQLTPQMRILLAVEPADFRRGIDGLAQLCRQRLGTDPLSGAMFVFANRRRKALKILLYDGYENTEIMGRGSVRSHGFRGKMIFSMEDHVPIIIASPERPGREMIHSGRPVAERPVLSGVPGFLSSC